MNYRSIAPAFAIGALLSMSACNDPATEPTDDYEMGAEETQPVINDMGDVQDLPPPETSDAVPPPPETQNLPATPPVVDPTEPEADEATAADPAMTKPSPTDPATDVDPAIEPVDPVAE